jgi:UDP-3-O-[3-hydroxymyristoyl] glucosamine N-acyltransferase
MRARASELAWILGGEFVPVKGDLEIEGVRGLDEAGPEHMSFLANERYAEHLASTRAGVVLVSPGVDSTGPALIRLDDPYLAFARAMQFFHPPDALRPGLHPSAEVDPSASVEGVEVRAFVTIGAETRVGEGTLLDAGVRIGRGVMIGRDCRILANAVVLDGSVLGDRVVLNPGAVVGGEGFGFAPTALGHVKIPQAGRAILEDDVELGCNTCVDRAAMEDTVLRRGVKVDNLVQVGHGVEVGEDGLLVAFAGIAGSTRIGRGATLAARAGVLGHLRLGDNVVVGAGSLVTRDVPDNARVAGYPAIDLDTWRASARVHTHLRELETLVETLQARVAELEKDRGGGTA